MAGRPINENEIAVVRWLLDYAAVADVTAFREKALTGLQVWPCCERCAGLLFHEKQRAQLGFEMLADALAVYPDGQTAGVLLWASGGELAWLELHDTFTAGTAKRFPSVSDLRTGTPIAPGDLR